MRSSLDNLVDGTDNGPLITHPDGDSPTEELQLDLSPTIPNASNDLCMPSQSQLGTTSDTVKFEQKHMTSASKTKVITDGFSSEQVLYLIPALSNQHLKDALINFKVSKK